MQFSKTQVPISELVLFYNKMLQYLNIRGLIFRGQVERRGHSVRINS